MATGQGPATNRALLVGTIVVLASASHLGGCADTRRSDFYAMRKIRVHAQRGDQSIIVRARPADLLTRERQALALSRSDD
ncbi:MAG: hypothetical protein D6695_08985 [Planctomycetota bacterium]|nr:MAG: hypothetical protein D6695_08985 [Planctomycetota bacterium]